jgi:hypothetical protein
LIRSYQYENDDSVPEFMNWLLQNNVLKFAKILISDDDFLLDFLLACSENLRLSCFLIVLDYLNYDSEIFFNMLVEEESFKALSLLLQLFKTSDLQKKVGELGDNEEFTSWAESLYRKVEKLADCLPFKPAAFLRAIKSAL